MLVELGLVYSLGNAVEVCEEIRRELPGFVLTLTRLTQQIVDQGLKVNLFLNVARRSLTDQ